jgi:glycosyltransferase involved in cell wall biosynthesis
MPVIVNPPPKAPEAKRREQSKYVHAPLNPDATPVFSVVMPAFNEEATIKDALEGLVDVMTGYGEPFEVLVVDDGSLDGTFGIVQPLSGAGTHVRLLQHEKNRGLGAALRTAFAAARGDFIVGSPVDSPLHRDQLQAFHDTLEARATYSYFPGSSACDVAVGFRPQRLGYKWWMTICSWIYRMMLRISFRTWLRDFNWICMYRRSIFEKVKIEFDGFSALPEILVKAKRAGFKLKQVPCPMTARKVGKGTVGKPGILIKAFTEFVRLWIRLTFSSSGGGKNKAASAKAGKEV